MAINTSFPRFYDFPDFKPTIGRDEFLNNGIKGSTLFFRKLNENNKSYIDPNNSLVIQNSRSTYDIVYHRVTSSRPLNFLGLRPLSKLDPNENISWALWYYMFCSGRRTTYDKDMISYRKGTIKAVYKYLKVNNPSGIYDPAVNPAATQTLLELAHARNYNLSGTMLHDG